MSGGLALEWSGRVKPLVVRSSSGGSAGAADACSASSRAVEGRLNVKGFERVPSSWTAGLVVSSTVARAVSVSKFDAAGANHP